MVEKPVGRQRGGMGDACSLLPLGAMTTEGGVRRHNNNTAQQQECCERGATTYVPGVVDVREGKREIGDGERKTVATAV